MVFSVYHDPYDDPYNFLFGIVVLSYQKPYLVHFLYPTTHTRYTFGAYMKLKQTLKNIHVARMAIIIAH